MYGCGCRGTSVKLGLFETEGKLLDKWEIPTRKENHGEQILPDVAASILKKLEERKIQREDVAGIGMGIPAPVDSEGVVQQTANVGWGYKEVTRELSELLDGMRVEAGNDANVAALGERWMGAGDNQPDVVFMTLGTGVGGGIVAEGKLLHGVAGAAGELGHITVDFDQPIACTCGKKGCLETVASATGIVNLTRRYADEYEGDSQLKVLIDNGEEVTAKTVFDLAKEGDALALIVYKNFSRYLGLAAANIGSTLNPSKIVIGGGVSILTKDMEDYLLANGYGVYRNDLKGMRADNNQKMWALYGNKEMAYDIDRNPEEQPSIEEMTRKAIDKLSKNPNGFFLMVEGSKVDWAAHGNDPVGMATDFLAFDRACGAALEFARNNGETAVVIVPDHGNSGISLGRKDCKGYDKLTKDQLFHQFSLYKLTAEGFANKVNSVPNSEVQNVFRTYAGFELTPEEMNALNNCKDYKNSPIPEDQRKPEDNSSMYSGSLTGLMAHIITSRTCFGFTTGGHTGEEVFLAAYHPQGTLPLGMNTNIELNEYLCNLFGLTHGNLEDLTSKNFARHTDVFEDYTCEIVPAADEKGSPTLIVKNKKDKKNS